jgi:multisubunit Na+/H+ antiporter MnhE subunit
MNDRRQRLRRQRVIRSLTAIPSVMLAWWLFDLAGDWSHGYSISQFFGFLFCVLGIDRIVKATVDLLVIALEPRNDQSPRAT